MDKNGSNPFSFKTFLKRGEGPPAPVSGDSAAAPSQTSTKKGSGRKKGGEKKTQIDVVPFPDEGADSSENPFSFSKFVERKSSQKPASSSHAKATPLFGSSSEDDEDLTAVNQVPLPTLAPKGYQNPPTASKGSRQAKVSSSSSSPPQLNKKEKQKKSKKQRKEISIFDISDGSDSDSNTVTVPSPRVSSVGGNIRGSRGRIGGSRGRQSGSRSNSGTSSTGNSPENPRRRELGRLGNGNILGDIDGDFIAMPGLKKLEVENERLRKELLLSQEEVKKHMEQNASLKSKIKVLKKKEAEDAKALEDMVQKVESNLVTTTQRAVSAEVSIGKLKKEIASLQSQLAKSTPQAVHQHYEEILRGVREKSTYASQQLAAASMVADNNIRELLSGVETLKNLAEILQFVDRISEVRTSEETPPS